MNRYALADIEAGIPSEAAAPVQHFRLPDVITKDRHKAMYLALRRLKRASFGVEAAVAACHIENEARCQPPLGRAELDGYLRRVWNQPDPPAKDAKRDETVEDLAAFLKRMESRPPLSWYVPGLIPDEGICLWHGQPRDFKSFCAQAVALALAAGYDAFDSERFHITRPVKVAYFTEEDPERLFAARMHWLTVKSPKPAPGFFFPFIRKSLSFDVKEDCDFIIRKLKETGAEVAVFDPGRSYSGLFDKGPADLRPVALFLRRIQNETMAKTLLLIHHDTKPKSEGPDSRSQQASGGGIFSISDCPVSFTKLDWNKVAVYPEDYKLSGDPTPFEVTFETDVRHGENGPQFGSWVQPVAVTKDERDIKDDAARQKILNFLRSTIGTWHDTEEVNKGAKLKKDSASSVLKKLLEDGLVLFRTGEDAKALDRSVKAKLWSGIAGPDSEVPF